MWRVMGSLLIGGFLLYRLMLHETPAPPAPAVAAGSDAGSAVYGELRVLLREAAVEVEIVGVVEFASAQACERRLDVAQRLPSCTAPRCEFKSFTCAPDVDARYRRMLDRVPAATRYVHIDYRHAGSPDPLSAVFVGWGMTVAASQAFCDSMVERWQATRSGTAVCI